MTKTHTITVSDGFANVGIRRYFGNDLFGYQFRRI